MFIKTIELIAKGKKFGFGGTAKKICIYLNN